jgi:hypothetical protein
MSAPHVVLGNNAAWCLHCGAEYPITMPCSITMLAAIGKAFNTDHRGCKPSENGRKRTSASTVEEWAVSWDTGLSSMAIYRHFRGIGHGLKGADHPWDPGDFGRCYRLLKIAPPEWREQIGEMGDYSMAWKALTVAWDELEALYEEELPSGKAPKLYARMKALLGLR